MTEEHKPNILTLKIIRDHKLTSENLTALPEIPSCDSHIDRVAEVCCVSCNSLPICMMCGHHGEHRGHMLRDVRIIARQEREKFRKSLAAIDEHSVNIQKLLEKVEDAERKLGENISGSKEKLRIQYVEGTERIKRQLQEIDNLLEMNKAEIDEVEKQELMELEKERKKGTEAAMKEINDKYDTLIHQKKNKNQCLRDGQEYLYSRRRTKNNRKLDFIYKKYKHLNTFINVQGDQKSEEIWRISKDADNRKKRFDSIISDSSILTLKNDWIHAHCLPDMTTAIDYLIEDVVRGQPDLESLQCITVAELPSSTAVTVGITEQPDSVIYVRGIEEFIGYKMNNMTTSDAGSIVVTGDVDDEHTHITLITIQGEVVHQRKEKNVITTRVYEGLRFRSCAFMSLFKVATTCRDREVGIYDTQNGTYVKKDMNDITGSWLDGHIATCVTVHRINKKIYIGTNSRNVFIVDDRLNYCRMLNLPDMIRCSGDLSVHDGNLIVCDYHSKRVCIVTTEGPDAEVVCELPKPALDGCDWEPLRISKDSDGFIYILWDTEFRGQPRTFLTQHSQSGRELLVTKRVDPGAFGITTVVTGNAEELLLATVDTGKIYSYGFMIN